jgi:thiamine biosynthesis lipoprotein
MPTVMAPRSVHVERCMGTVFTIDVRDAGQWSDAIDEVVAWLHQVDAMFSTYKQDSQISRLQRGELAAATAHADVRAVLDLCADAQARTDQHFTAMAHGHLDPTGLVKGWAIERASRLLIDRGATNHAVNGGGDMQLAGESAIGQPWRVGISDPHDRTRLVTTVSGRDLAIATSGNSERGQHIINPRTGRPSVALASATVIGPSLTYADAYATAAFVMGEYALGWITDIDEYELFLVTTDGHALASSGWPRN